MLKLYYGESVTSLAFLGQILLASVSVSLFVFPAFQCPSTSSLLPKRNCAVFQVCEKWLEKSNLTKRGLGSMGEGLPVLGGKRGQCFLRESWSHKRGIGKDGQEGPSRDNGRPREPNHGPSSDHLHPWEVLRERRDWEICSTTTTRKKVWWGRVLVASLFSLLTRGRCRGLVFHRRHNQTLSPLQTEDSSP